MVQKSLSLSTIAKFHHITSPLNIMYKQMCACEHTLSQKRILQIVSLHNITVITSIFLLSIIHYVILTLSDTYNRVAPSGINAMPIAKNAGNTVFAVRIGCHAGSLCCLNFVSVKKSFSKVNDKH